MNRESPKKLIFGKPDHDEHTFWIKVMGKMFRVRGIFTCDLDANAFMKDHPETGVICVHGPFIFVANNEAAPS